MKICIRSLAVLGLFLHILNWSSFETRLTSPGYFSPHPRPVSKRVNLSDRDILFYPLFQQQFQFVWLKFTKAGWYHVEIYTGLITECSCYICSTSALYFFGESDLTLLCSPCMVSEVGVQVLSYPPGDPSEEHLVCQHDDGVGVHLLHWEPPHRVIFNLVVSGHYL